MNVKMSAMNIGMICGFLAMPGTVLAQDQQQHPTAPGQAKKHVLLDSVVGGSLLLPVKPDLVKQQANRNCRDADTQGLASLKAGDTAKAITRFQSALSSVPLDVLAQEHLAEAYAENGQPEQAIAAYRALLYHPEQPNMGTSAETNSTVLMRFALVLFRTGERTEALAVYQHGYRYLPTDRGPLPPLFTSPDFSAAAFTAAADTAMGLFEMAGGAASDAPGDFERAIAAQPTLPAPYFYRGLKLKGQPGRANDALADFRRAEQLGGPAVKPFVDDALKDGTTEFMQAVKKAQVDTAP